MVLIYNPLSHNFTALLSSTLMCQKLCFDPATKRAKSVKNLFELKLDLLFFLLLCVGVP